MYRILTRSGKSPFESMSVYEALARGSNLSNVGNLLDQTAFYRHIYNPAASVIGTIQNPVPSQVDEINATYDAFYVPLGSAFRPGFLTHLSRLSRVIERLKIPVVVVGVGVHARQNPRKELAFLERDVREFCARVLDKSVSIGVRGQQTADYLDDLGVRGVEVVGCPSMFYGGPVMPDVCLQADWTQGHTGFQWNLEDKDLFQTGIRALLNLLSSCEKVTYFSQLDEEARRLFLGDKGSEYLDAMLREERLHLAFPTDAHTWIAALARCKLLIGSHVQGVVAGLLAGTPSLLVTHDCRVSELSEHFCIPSVSMDAVNAPSWSLQEQLEATDWNSHRAVHAQRFEAYVAFLNRNGVHHTLGSDQWAANSARYDERILQTPFQPVLTTEALTWEHFRDFSRHHQKSMLDMKKKLTVLSGRIAALEGRLSRAS